MTGKVFPAGNDSAVACTLNPCRTEFRNFPRFSSKRAGADDGISRIRVDVQNGSEVDIDPCERELDRGCISGAVGEGRLVIGCDLGGWRKMGEWRREGMRPDSLLIAPH